MPHSTTMKDMIDSTSTSSPADEALVAEDAARIPPRSAHREASSFMFRVVIPIDARDIRLANRLPRRDRFVNSEGSLIAIDEYQQHGK